MSSTTNQKQSLWKEVEAQLRSTLMEINADRTTVLKADDALTWARTLILSGLVLQDLLSDGSRLRSDGSLKQWCFSIAKVDILEVAKGLKEFQLFLRCYPDEWSFLSYSDFKHRFPYRFTGDFWSPVKDVLLSYLANPVPATFKVLNQWVSFPTKLTLQGLADNLTQQAEDEYLANEARLATLKFSQHDIDDISSVLASWFKDFGFNFPFSPHHSNGAVANRITSEGLYGKYQNMSSDCRIDYLYRRFAIDPKGVGFSSYSHLDPRSKLITVPKGIDKRRSICPEPAEYQFNQQGVWDRLDEFISHSPLRYHISIHDQSVNRGAALEASRMCNAATIDLSSASDSVSWDLIKKVFRHCHPLLQMMAATRSKRVLLPSGRVITTCKFAPMGSALCFPIESILFAAMCRVAEKRTGCRNSGETYHVYGDDIIVPTDCFEETVAILTRCGFLVNELKTFPPYSRYKESCGLEGLDGVDVSCLGISRKFSAGPLDRYHPELVACYVALANDLFIRGFRSARNFILAPLLSLPYGYCPPFSEDGRFGILSSQPTNYRCKIRWNDGLQKAEIKVGIMCSDFNRWLSPVEGKGFRLTQNWGDRDDLDSFNDIRYLETQRRLASTKRSSLLWPEDLIQVDIRKPDRILRSRWLPAEWFFSPQALNITEVSGYGLSMVPFNEGSREVEEKN